MISSNQLKLLKNHQDSLQKGIKLGFKSLGLYDFIIYSHLLWFIYYLSINYHIYQNNLYVYLSIKLEDF
jgi:hypothetical protein